MNGKNRRVKGCYSRGIPFFTVGTKSIPENPPKDKGSESEPLNDEGQITLF